MRIFALLLLLFVSSARADLGSDVDAIVRRYVNSDSFNGAVLIRDGESNPFSRAYGKANFETDTANTPRTRFVIRSISKQFTAAAILALEEAGKLGTSDPLARHLAVPSSWRGITIHQLLTHTSGLDDYAAFPSLMDVFAEFHSPETLLEFFRAGPLHSAPGSAYFYSNPAYVILARLVEKLSGKDFRTYLKEKVFEPAGMHDSGEYHQSIILPRRATGYVEFGGSYGTACCEDFSNSIGAGSLYSTVEDLARWNRALDRPGVLSARSLEKFFAPSVQMGDASAPYYAYGWIVDRVAGHAAVWHNGLGNGFRSQMIRFPEEKVAVIILSNWQTETGIRNIGRMAVEISARYFAH